MPRSMTGFGKGEDGGFVVEMRSVNHKFLDLSIRMPKDLFPLEARLKKAVGEKLSRGRVDIFITRGGSEEAPKVLKLDTAAVKQYLSLLTELKNSYDLPGQVDLSLLASYKDVMAEVEVMEDIDAVWQALAGPLDDALNALNSMREQEGGVLAHDIRERAGLIALNVDAVEKKAPLVVQEYAKRLRERIAQLAEGVDLDEGRLMQEAAIFADRSDITEEIVRARSHLAQLEAMLADANPVGRKMDFLLQEINREVNTMGSKASDQEIARRVVEMKAELEKVREQVQNIE